MSLKLHWLRRGTGKALLALASKVEYSAADELLIIVVAFNRPDLVAQQVDAILRYGTDVSLLIADNSNDGNLRCSIRNTCQRSRVRYVSLPSHPIIAPSDSHGWALNWSYRHIVRSSGQQRFGFIDHDIFPTASFEANDLLQGQPFYGLKQSRGDAWYLWPGFSFFDRSKIIERGLDFMPARLRDQRLDTGGGNWRLLYSRSGGGLKFATHLKPLPPSQYVEIIDGIWGHLGAASRWNLTTPQERPDG